MMLLSRNALSAKATKLGLCPRLHAVSATGSGGPRGEPDLYFRLGAVLTALKNLAPFSSRVPSDRAPSTSFSRLSRCPSRRLARITERAPRRRHSLSLTLRWPFHISHGRNCARGGPPHKVPRLPQVC